jgi:Arc/MetJ-type ribon-helix-helix transcriptional regulator
MFKVRLLLLVLESTTLILGDDITESTATRIHLGHYCSYSEVLRSNEGRLLNERETKEDKLPAAQRVENEEELLEFSGLHRTKFVVGISLKTNLKINEKINQMNISKPAFTNFHVANTTCLE